MAWPAARGAEIASVPSAGWPGSGHDAACGRSQVSGACHANRLPMAAKAMDCRDDGCQPVVTWPATA
jgi:hypothetical protein